MLRLAQFEIALHLGEDATVRRTASAVDAETRLTPAAPEEDRLFRAMALNKMLMRTKAPLTPEFVVRAVAELSEIQAGSNILQDLVSQLPADILPGMPQPFNFGVLLTIFLPGRLKTVADLVGLWAALEALDPSRRDMLLRASGKAK
jgi:hypothetical protein